MTEEKWKERRAVTALLEIADEALMAAQAVAPDGPVILVEKIHAAREAVIVAKQRAEIDLR